VNRVGIVPLSANAGLVRRIVTAERDFDPVGAASLPPSPEHPAVTTTSAAASTSASAV
jgi:hypothetical protein